MNTNIFIENSESIKEHYIVSLVGEEKINRYYVKSSLPQEWIDAFKNTKAKTITSSHHEKRLIKYFENPKALKSKQPLILIVGSVGSGKSSSVMYAMHKANVCKGCQLESTCDKNYPDRIIVNYLKFKNTADNNQEDNKDLELNDETIKKFWQHIINILDKSINTELSVEDEVRYFWPWLLNNNEIGIHHSFYDFMDINREEILDASTTLADLKKLRREFRSTLNKKNLTYYKLYQINYLRNDRTVKCNFLLFDNIDTLPPVLQKELIDFSEEAYELLESKSILLVRPLTYMRNKGASDYTEKIDHAKANLKEVFLKRLERLKKDPVFFENNKIKNVDSLISCLEKAIMLFPKTKTYRDVFVATSGRSIRYGLRNFYNFLLSPLMVTHQDGKELDSLEFSDNIFFQAYFCGEGDPQRIDETNFVNLLSVSHSSRVQYLSNIKIRILDIMLKKEIIEVSNLTQILVDFGYDLYNIRLAINDMLRSRKALLWSSHYTSYGSSELLQSVDHTLRLTDLGFRYYDTLLTYVNYFRECLIPIQEERLYGGSPNLKNVYEIIRELEECDLTQIKNYITKKGLSEYLKLYPDSRSSISLIIWEKLFDNIKFQNIRYSDIIIDLERDKYIIKRTKQVKREAEMNR